MLKRFIPILITSLFSQFLFAQRPENIRIEPSAFPMDSRAACNNSAGNCSQTLGAGSQTNDKTYLCKNDVLNIKNTGPVDLTGDPIISTPAGVGYAWYSCKPTVTGTLLSQITADPCIFKGLPASPPTNGLFVTTQNVLTGNVKFTNDGFLQTTYNSGKPIKFTFAPITFDKLDSKGFAVYEGTPTGSCVNVKTTASFDVVYLNAINKNVINQGNLTGSFKVFGGLPEYDPAATYTIDVSLKSNPATKGTVTGGATTKKNNDNVTFTTTQNGVYTITIVDGKSCASSFDMTLSSAFDIVLKGDTLCDPANTNGVFTVLPSGGTSPYSFTWKKGAGAASASQTLLTAGTSVSGLSPGTYSVTAVDGGGLTVTKTVVIEESSNITGVKYGVTLSPTSPKCANTKDGSLTANISGGFGPFYFQWDTGEAGFGVNPIVGLDAGGNPYSVTVTDKLGCVTSAQTNLIVNKITISNQNVKDATCSGIGDGEISLTADKGTSISGNYKFTWSWNNFSQISKTSTISNLKDGTYFVTISDDNGCERVDSFVVKPGKTLSINETVTNIKCFGDKTGKILAQGNTVGGATATPYTFSFSPSGVGNLNATASSATYDQLPAGIYSVTMTDQSGCTVQKKNINVTQPTKLDLNVVAQNDPTCAGAAKDGSVEIKAIGGTLAAGNNYKYKWSNNNTTPKVSNLVAGTISVSVTDDNGCLVTKDFTLKAPASPKVTNVTVKNVDCSNSTNGSIKVTATPASAGDQLTYTWSNTGTSSEIFNLPPNKYSVTVTDQKGCFVKLDTAVTSPLPLVLKDTMVTSPVCTNDKNGSIVIEMKGGTPDYKFLWEYNGVKNETTGATKGNLTNLAGTLYSVSVQDAKGCIGPVYLINVPKPIETKVKFSDVKDISCVNSGIQDGKATCTVTQGNVPNTVYSFTWSNQSTDTGTSSDEDKLKKGMNYVTVTDGVCPIVDSVFIGSPDKVSFDSTKLDVTGVTCFGKSDGAAIIAGKGGISPYEYEWSTGDKKPSITAVVAGDYIVKITDANKCAFEKIVTIPTPAKLTLISDPANTKAPSCAGYNDGVITLKYEGGNPGPVSFSWKNNVSTSSVANNLFGGSYEATVTDSKGCFAITSEGLKAPDKIEFTLDTIKSPTCAGYLTDIKIKTAKGGSGSMLGNYTFSIDDGGLANAKNDVIPIYAGEHFVKVFDPNGCPSEGFKIKVNDPPAIKVYLGPDVELELGDSYEINASIEATAPIVKYTWTPTIGLTFSDSCKNDCGRLIRPLEDGSYILMVTDTIGCSGSDTIKITIDRNRNVYIPNAFSPNVDGTNDFMEVYADPQSVETINYLHVYDRWGNFIFESPSFKPADYRVLGNRWDGYYKGIKANEGVYVYVCEVKFIDGVVLRFRGDITVVR
jgi:gliding motility-associated-like protein